MSQHIQISVPADSEHLELAAEFLRRAAEIADRRQLSPVAGMGDNWEKITTGPLTPIPSDIAALEDSDIDNLFGESEETATDAFSAEEVQAAAPKAPAPKAPAPEPVYKFDDKGEGFSEDEYREQGWTSEMLIEHGYLVAVPFAPTPAAVAPAPTAPAAPKPSSPTLAAPATTSAATVSAGVELDKEGIPWDSRIHSSSREKIQNGTFKVKRNTPPELVAEVKNELRALLANSGIKTPAPAVNKAPPPTPNKPAAPAPATGGVTPCAALMRRVSAAIRAGTLTQPQMLAAVNKHGVAQVKDLNDPANAEKIPDIEKELFPS